MRSTLSCQSFTACLVPALHSDQQVQVCIGGLQGQQPWRCDLPGGVVTPCPHTRTLREHTARGTTAPELSVLQHAPRYSRLCCDSQQHQCHDAVGFQAMCSAVSSNKDPMRSHCLVLLVLPQHQNCQPSIPFPKQALRRYESGRQVQVASENSTARLAASALQSPRQRGHAVPSHKDAA